MPTAVVKPKKSFLNIELGGIKDVEIMMFTKHLSVTLKSGLTLLEAIEILGDQAKGKLKTVISKIYQLVSTGQSFNESLAQFPKYFSTTYVNLVRSGEVSGTLQEKLDRLAVQLEKGQNLKRKIKSAMIYPTLIFVAVFGLGMSVAIFILPKILPLFRSLDTELPATTKGLIWVAEVFETHGLEIFIGVVILSIVFAWMLRRDIVKPFTHAIILKIPTVKDIIKNINLENFSRTLGTLLESGLTVDQSLKITAQATNNRVYRKAIESFIPEVQAGNNLSLAIAKYPKLFPLISSRMVGVGEKTGSLDTTLNYLAGFYEETVDNATKNLATIIEPVMLIIIGVVVGTVAIAILGPIYEITGNIGG